MCSVAAFVRLDIIEVIAIALQMVSVCCAPTAHQTPATLGLAILIMQIIVNGSATLVMKKLEICVFFVSKENTPLEVQNHVNPVKCVLKTQLLAMNVWVAAQVTQNNVNAEKVFMAVELFVTSAVMVNTSQVSG